MDICEKDNDMYMYGFNGQVKDNEWAGIGNFMDFGERGLDSRIGRWGISDPKESKYPSLSSYHFGFDNPIVTVDADGKENVVVVGEQYENSSANKLMFVHQAISKLNDYAKNESDETRTLIIFSNGYTQKQLSRIEQVATKPGAAVIKVNTAEEFVDYVNTKSTSNKEKISSLRESDKVTNIDAFSHGVIGEIRFGYQMDNDNIAKFDQTAASRLNPDAFKAIATFASYACRTGLGNKNLGDVVFPWSDLQKGKSLAQVISNVAQITTKAFFKRTSYTNTLGSRFDRFALSHLPMPPGGTPQGGLTQKRVNSREDIDGAIFDPQGAVHPVEGGSTPYGASSEMQTFTPETSK